MLKAYQNQVPKVHATAKVFEGAVCVGNVHLESDVGVWHHATLRADMASITIGEGTNVQDHVVIHTDTDQPTVIGRFVTIGHKALVHACTIHDHALIGMGAILLNGCVIEEGAMVAAGALVPPGKVVPKGHLALGSPMKVVRPLTALELEKNKENAQTYIRLKNTHG
jgi:carbonic anhydrase/acetyltransferase-like protein (isoleucine patch superfamily)